MLLDAVGALLAADQVEVRIVVVGGAALGVTDLVHRTTADVDILAQAKASTSEHETPFLLVPSDPLPPPLLRAAATVARDSRLPSDWMNTEIAAQWRGGLPPGLDRDLTWRTFGGLTVGFAGRETLILLKLFAATDQGPGSVHFQDLVALRPTAAELERAAAWVVTQDAAPAFAGLVGEMVAAVASRLRPHSDDRS